MIIKNPSKAAVICHHFDIFKKMASSTSACLLGVTFRSMMVTHFNVIIHFDIMTVILLEEYLFPLIRVRKILFNLRCDQRHFRRQFFIKL